MKLEPHRSEEAIVKVVGPAFFAFLFIYAQISAGDLSRSTVLLGGWWGVCGGVSPSFVKVI